MSARRKILSRYEVPNTGGLVVLNYRQEPHAWYVTVAGSRRCTMRHRRQPTGPHAHATYRRATLTRFRCYGSAVLAAHYLPRPPPKRPVDRLRRPREETTAMTPKTNEPTPADVLAEEDIDECQTCGYQPLNPDDAAAHVHCERCGALPDEPHDHSGASWK